MPTSASNSPRAPSAIAAAVSDETAPYRRRRSSPTPSVRAFTSVAYATSPPRTAADEPGTSVNAAHSSPPVSDSAVATVCPAMTSALITSAGVDAPSGGMTLPHSQCLCHVIKPGHHRHRHGHGHDRNLHRSEEHTSELQSRGHLVCRLL